MSTQQPLKILEISAGARSEGSISRLLTADLIAALGFQPKQVAVERNKVIVRRDDHACTTLEPGDCLEVVTFFGGG